MKDKKHIFIVFSIVFLIACILFFASRFLKPSGFDEYGHYRWDAVGEISNQDIIIQNTKTCVDCHEDIYILHEKDAHFNVPCVDCHGDGKAHVIFHRASKLKTTAIPEYAKMPKEYFLEGCLFCHRKLKARPSDFPQINKNEHYKFLHISDTSTKCIDCHNPHEPIFLLTEARKAKMHPVVYKCTDCHDKKPVQDYKQVNNHPTIFECKDCHSEIVKSFKSRPHNEYVECRTCHLFHRENESVGRMYKNGNAKFCMLCHLNKPFKDSTYPPKIDWPQHVKSLKYIKNLNQKICLNCHWDQIHKMEFKNETTPHQEKWIKKHGKFIKEKNPKNISQTKCQNCHQSGYCYNCHQVNLPHSDEFLTGHNAIIKLKGKKLCRNCHIPEFCTFCHDNPN